MEVPNRILLYVIHFCFNQPNIQRWPQNGPFRCLGWKIDHFWNLGRPDRGTFWQKNCPRKQSDAHIGLKRKKWKKNQLLRNKEKGNIDFHICLKVPIGPTDHAKKVGKKWGAHWFFCPAVKSSKNPARLFWDCKKGKIKNFFSYNSLSLYTLKIT